MRCTIKNFEVVNRCVYNLYVIVVNRWLNNGSMLHWPTSNLVNSKHETLNQISLMLGPVPQTMANIKLPLDQCIVLAEIQHPLNQP